MKIFVKVDNKIIYVNNYTVFIANFRQIKHIFKGFLFVTLLIQGSLLAHIRCNCRRCSVKTVLLEISQDSQENTCARVSFKKFADLRSVTLLKKRLWHSYFPVNFAKFLRTPFLIEHLRWPLLYIIGNENRRLRMYVLP